MDSSLEFLRRARQYFHDAGVHDEYASIHRGFAERFAAFGDKELEILNQEIAELHEDNSRIDDEQGTLGVQMFLSFDGHPGFPLQVVTDRYERLFLKLMPTSEMELEIAQQLIRPESNGRISNRYRV